MVDFAYVLCPSCTRRFMVHQEFTRIPESYCHCPYCGNEFKAGEGHPAQRTDQNATAPRSM